MSCSYKTKSRKHSQARTPVSDICSPTVSTQKLSDYDENLIHAANSESTTHFIEAITSSDPISQVPRAPQEQSATCLPIVISKPGVPSSSISINYSHNSKTTRSWPVIYRNPQHYDYEALYAINSRKSNENFDQNSNELANSINYASSNENLAVKECGTSSNAICANNNKFQKNPKTQTTCYYFASSPHRSIYETNTLSTSKYFDPSASVTAVTVERLCRSNSLLFRNSSCRKMMQSHHLRHDGTPTSAASAIGGNSEGVGSTYCSSCCIGPPHVLFLFITLLMTTSATAMLCAAIMTDHWEHVTWDRQSLDRISNYTDKTLEWILNEKVAIIVSPIKDHRYRRDSVFLVPMHGGIWTLCIDLLQQEMHLLRRHRKFPKTAVPCVNYLAGSMENARGEETRNDWQHSEFQMTLQPHLRMQNLSISCSLVCLIILGSAALVGAFGVCQRQISAILITGVMYLLAGLFALFTLMIIHFKRQQGRPMLDSDFDGTVDGVVALRGTAKTAQEFLGARVFITSWSLDLGWGGVVLCSIASVLWILLSKIMRYNHFSAFNI